MRIMDDYVDISFRVASNSMLDDVLSFSRDFERLSEYMITRSFRLHDLTFSRIVHIKDVPFIKELLDKYWFICDFKVDGEPIEKGELKVILE